MAGLGSLVIDLSADTAKFQSDMGRAAQIADRNMASIKNTIAGASTAIAASATAAGAALILMTRNALNAADDLGKLAQKVGIGVESLSELKFGAELADVGMDSLATGLRKFNVAMVEAANPASEMSRVFKALGVDITRGPEPALRQFAQALSLMEDGELKTAAATKVLGKAGADLIPWLNAGAKGFDDAAKSARDLGLIISEQTAKSAEELNDNLKKLGSTAEAMGISMVNYAVSGLVTFTDELVKAKERGEGLIGVLKEIGKAALATMAQLPGELGNLAGMAADAAFQGGGGAMGGPKSGTIRRPGNAMSDDQIFAENLPPDSGALRRALSGQTKAKDDAAKKELDRLKELGQRILRSEQNMEAERAEFRRFETEEGLRLIEEAAEDRLRIEEGMFNDIRAQEEAYYEQGRQALEIRKAQLKELEDAGKKWESVARDIGMTFTSMFEDAVVNGKGFSEILKGLEQDLLKLGTRLLITEPLMRKFTELLKGGFGGGMTGDDDGNPLSSSGLGDIFASAGKWIMDLIPKYAMGTDYVPRTGLALVHQGEKIIPAGQGGGMNFSMIVQTPDANSFRASRNQIAGEMQSMLAVSRRNR